MRTRVPGKSTGTIVYIHGLGESGLCFERLINDECLGSWTHIAPDLKGYGKSPWRKTHSGLVGHADDIAHWLSTQDISHAVVMGHSMGGVIGMILCERHPWCAQCFIDVEGNVSSEDCTMSGAIAGFSEEEFAAHGIEKIRSTTYQGGFRNKALRTYYASLVLCDPHTLYRDSLDLVEISRSLEIPSRLACLAVPGVYILGSPGGTGEYSRSLLHDAGVRVCTVEDSAHWPFLDHQDAFIDALLACI